MLDGVAIRDGNIRHCVTQVPATAPVVYQDTAICYRPLLRFLVFPMHVFRTDNIKKAVSTYRSPSHRLKFWLRVGTWQLQFLVGLDAGALGGFSGSRRFKRTFILHIKRSVWATALSLSLSLGWKPLATSKRLQILTACQSVMSLFHHCDTKISHIGSFFLCLVWLVQVLWDWMLERWGGVQWFPTFRKNLYPSY